MILNIAKAAGIIIFIYLWNHFLIPFMIGTVVKFHKRHNKENLNKQPVKFLIQNESKIVFVYQSFFWIGAILGVVTMFMN